MLRSSLGGRLHTSLISLRIYASATSSHKLNSSAAQYQLTNTEEIVNFRDAKVAFAATTTLELIRSSLVYRLCSCKFIVDHNKKLMEISRKLLGRNLFKILMKMTIYGQFVAGENQEQIQTLIQRYRRYGVKSILDYSVEKDIPESEVVKKLETTLAEAIHVPGTPSKGAMMQYRPSIEFADRRKDVYSARTYFYESESQCDANMEIIMKCIDASAKGIANEGFVAIKLTALGRPQFLLQFSDFLVQMERFFNLLVKYKKPDYHIPPSLAYIDLENFQKRLQTLGIEISCDKSTHYFTLFDTSGDGVVDLLDWLHFKHFDHDLASIFQVRNKETGEMEQLVSTLTPQGIEEMRNMIHRIDNLAQYAKLKGVRLMVDAEHSYFQPAIRRITMEMMRRFNKDNTVVFNTYQCYLKNTLHELHQDLTMAESHDFYFGAKLVRGAYIEQERKRAKMLGYPDPTNPNFEATTAMYDACLEETFSAIERRPRGRVSAMVATHNEDTVRLALKRMKEHNILPEHRLICFGQLLGMCDHVSFPLGHAGYSVYKYVPYGPVEEVLPYLSRRANENQSMLSDVSVERQMRWTELKRRLFEGDLFLKLNTSHSQV